MGQAPILGAGGIVVRGGSKPLIAVVQRSKDGSWVLPKGKLKQHEDAIAGAQREVVEETGQDVIVHEFLGVISYTVGRKPKLVQFWRMEAIDHPPHKLTKDIKAVKWLSLETAIKKLASPLEQVFLRNVAERALAGMMPTVTLEPSSTAVEAVTAAAELPAEPELPLEQPTALTLPIVEPDFASAPRLRDDRETKLPIAELPPKPDVVPTPIARPVVLTTSAPKPSDIVVAAPIAEPAATSRPPLHLAVTDHPIAPMMSKTAAPPKSGLRSRHAKEQTDEDTDISQISLVGPSAPIGPDVTAISKTPSSKTPPSKTPPSMPAASALPSLTSASATPVMANAVVVESLPAAATLATARATAPVVTTSPARAPVVTPIAPRSGPASTQAARVLTTVVAGSTAPVIAAQAPAASRASTSMSKPTVPLIPDRSAHPRETNLLGRALEWITSLQRR
jgi:8-oxo-dGTP diphosphatase